MGRKPEYTLALSLDDDDGPAVAEHAPPAETAEEFITGERAIPEPEGVEIHPAARIMPMMGAEDFSRLRANIRAHGYDPRKPLVFIGHALLDGRNRLAAALAEGLRFEDLPKVQMPEGEDPIDFVERENLHRRQLSPGQRAAAAAAANKLREAEARTRMVEGGRRGGRKGGDDSSPPLPRDEHGRSAVQAAAQYGAGIGSTKTLIAIQERAPEVAELVRDNAVSVAEAKRLFAEKDPERRAQQVAAIRGGADPAKVVPPRARPEPNLGRQLGLYAARCGRTLEPFRDLLVRLNLALDKGETSIVVGKKTLSLAEAGERLAELLPRPRAGGAARAASSGPADDEAALAIACPAAWCRAAAGSSCVTSDGRSLGRLHAARQRAAEEEAP